MARRTRTTDQHEGSPDEVSLHIDAPAERLYDIVSDVGAMGRLSPECKGGRWRRGASGPAVGAVFVGRNRRGPIVWWTSNEVVEANRGREFAFHTRQSGYRWTYRFEPTPDGGTVVTESRAQFKKRRPVSAKLFTAALLGGVEEHDEEMRDGMRRTLGRLEQVAATTEPTGRRARRKQRKADEKVARKAARQAAKQAAKAEKKAVRKAVKKAEKKAARTAARQARKAATVAAAQA